MSSTLLLHVRPDGSGQAVITSRVFESGIRAFDGLFPERPAEAPKLEDLLPTISNGELQSQLGAKVRLVSTKLDKANDGGIRTTIVEFDDVTALQLRFPPVFMSMSHGFGMDGIGDQPLITFAIKPHENGDRLLLVKLPDARLPAKSPAEDPVTTFQTDSPEEQLFKKAIKGASVRFFVELEQPLLRTNAPAQGANRATILDLDLDKMINAMDEEKVRRMMSQGSLQEVLWQVGNLPGAVVPIDHEIFLEYEGPRAPQAPAAAPAAQAPPDTEIYLAPMKLVNGAIDIGPAVDITNNAGYDNQPFFTPDGRGVLFTSVRGGGTQTDIYRYDITSKQISQVTSTAESEYSPTVTPAGNLSVIRVELDAAKTQRLWQFNADGTSPRLVLENVKPVGYHAWADEQSLALFVLGQPATLQLADTRSGSAVVLASDIGRSIQRIPTAGTSPATISFVQRERSGEAVSLTIKELNAASREISVLTPAVAGSTEADCAWTPDGTLLMVKGSTLYGWRRGQSGWNEVASLERLGLSGITRLAVSPKGDYLALVGLPRPRR
jgi:WD40-like Beta Propeller Repeat